MIRDNLCDMANAAPLPPNLARILRYSSPNGDLLLEREDAAIFRHCPALFFFFCILLLMILPPVIFVLGTRLSHAAKCLALFHLFISRPVSDMNSRAVISFTLGILHKSTP